MGRSKSCRPGTDDGHCLALGRKWSFLEMWPFFPEIRCRPLDVADVDRLPQLRLPVPAFVLAGARANTTQNAGKDVGHLVDVIGPAVTFLEKAPYVGWNVGGSRTRALTGHIDSHVIEIFRLRGVTDLLLHCHLFIVSAKHVVSIPILR
jgi:predicted small secreted protein